jgi:large subunit ribosomal protein L7/L12
MNNKINIILELIKELTLYEGNQLIIEFEKFFEINNLNSTNLLTPIISTSENIEIIEEKNTFDIILEYVPVDKKITILKIVRNITGLGLKESKEIVDNVPKVLKTNITKEESNTIKTEIESVGGKILIK